MVRARRDRTPAGRQPSLRFSRVNAVFIAAGVLAIAGGYALVTAGSTVAAPLLLVLGYVVLIPVGIIL